MFTRLVLFLALCAAVSVSGCVEQDEAARPSPVSTATAATGDFVSAGSSTAEPSPLPGCDPHQPIQISSDDDYGPPEPPEAIVARAELALTARVVEVLPPRWTTEDGSRPNPCIEREPFVPFERAIGEIVTPVVVEFDGEFIGGDWEFMDVLRLEEIHPGDRLILMLEGGQIDDDIFTNELRGHSSYRVGERVVLALAIWRPGAERWTGNWGHAVPWHLVEGAAWIPVMKWIVDEDGTAIADYGGSDPATLPLDELIDRLVPAVEPFPTVIAD